MFDVVLVAMTICALLPAAMFLVNYALYLEPGMIESGRVLPALSVLIPARDEERAIRGAVESVLASEGVAVEVIVMDDASGDQTAAIVREMSARDARVRLEQAPVLPRGWNGKQHACWALAHAATHERMCFMDADVRVEPSALARMTGFLEDDGAALVSGFPRQVTKSTMEWLLLPLIHFVLLGFLPLPGMRRTTNPGYAAGCGQFLLVRRAEYFASGGHAAIRETMHDGLRLPKLLREHGLKTDLADLTRLVRCRMYRSATQVWNGLAKNATEGIAAPARIVPISTVLLLGQVVPFAVLVWLLVMRRPVAVLEAALVFVAVLAAWLPRVLAAFRYQQKLRSAWLHPLGITVLLVLQWYALVRKVTGGAVSWKTRSYAGE
jgi:hypothetical protein